MGTLVLFINYYIVIFVYVWLTKNVDTSDSVSHD